MASETAWSAVASYQRETPRDKPVASETALSAVASYQREPSTGQARGILCKAITQIR